MTRGRRGTGFTLLELLVAVTVVGIALLVAAPALSGPTDRDDESVVRRLLVRGAATAARLDRPVSIGLDQETGFLILSVADSVLAREALADGSVEFPAMVNLSFFPDGRSVGGPILLVAPGGVTTIHVDRWTSRVTVERS